MGKFNPLTDEPSLSVAVHDIEYKINTDFRAAIGVWDIIEKYESGEIKEKCNGNETLAIATFNTMMIDKIFHEPKPDIFCEPALKLVSNYLSMFSNSATDRKKSNMPPYGYLAIEQDADMLYGAFLSIGINLRETKLTYENFLAMLPNLPEDCEYCKVMSLRSEWYDHKPKDKKQRKELEERVNRIGKSKVLLRDKEKQKEVDVMEEYDRYLERMRKEQGIVKG
jgi:hypothetical protein